MKRIFPLLLMVCALFGLAACSGIPLRSVPRLLSLQSAIMQADPADLMLAVQMDARMVPPSGAVPYLILKITPVDSTAFEPVDRRLPMGSVATTTALLGLPSADWRRRWLIFSLPIESQREFLKLRERFKQLRAESTRRSGGVLSVGIEQEGIAVRDPEFASSRWGSWLQVSRREGFFELWTGTVSDLLGSAKR